MLATSLTAVRAAIQAGFRRANGKLAFVSLRDGNQEIYITDQHNNRVVRFDMLGRVIADFGRDELAIPKGIAADTNRARGVPPIAAAKISVANGVYLTLVPPGNQPVAVPPVTQSNLFSGPLTPYA